MPDTALDVYRRWAPDGKPVLAGGKWPCATHNNVYFVNKGPWDDEPTWLTEVRGDEDTILPGAVNALCRAQALGELMEWGWCVLSASHGVTITDDKDEIVVERACLDDALAEALRKVNQC